MLKSWEKLEHYLARKISETFKIYARRTKGSGNGNENGDTYNELFATECKYRNTKNVTINIDVWNKNKADIPLNSHKIPLLALENKTGMRFIVLEADDFFDILKETSKWI